VHFSILAEIVPRESNDDRHLRDGYTREHLPENQRNDAGDGSFPCFFFLFRRKETRVETRVETGKRVRLMASCTAVGENLMEPRWWCCARREEIGQSRIG